MAADGLAPPSARLSVPMAGYQQLWHWKEMSPWLPWRKFWMSRAILLLAISILRNDRKCKHNFFPEINSVWHFEEKISVAHIFSCDFEGFVINARVKFLLIFFQGYADHVCLLATMVSCLVAHSYIHYRTLSHLRKKNVNIIFLLFVSITRNTWCYVMSFFFCVL